ncbi:hypothetical protein [Nonomuraea jabiensis]|uniref:Uncharacterized protein n=1 Tax=Nonomuraea jabiensis TaxID=882448 RepID=A0A7W9G8X4_9ACTN|nr:hypothetical protein [Nonomuraea jabiensis]MBB5779301.1 hypothetical protein [Nonomuraea jabiensis]
MMVPRCRSAELTAQAPLVVDVTLDRPAVLTPVAELATVLLGSFSSSDRALALVVTGRATPRGDPRCQQNARDPSGRTGTRRSQCT